MKRVFCFAAFLFIYLSADARQGFTLKGTLPPELNGKKIFFSTLDYSAPSTSRWTKDSMLVENGSFHFTGRINNPAILANLQISRPDFGYIQFYIENRDINVRFFTSKKQNLLDSFVFDNAPVSQQHLELQKRKTAIFALMGEHSKKMDAEYAKASDSVKKKLQAEMSRLFAEEKKITVQFIKDRPDYYLSLYSLCYFIPDAKVRNEDSLTRLYYSLSPRLQQLPEGQAFIKKMQAVASLKKDQPAPVFNIRNEKGKQVSLDNYKGKYVLLDFWASWCGPCIENLPAVTNLYKKYHGKGLEIIAISLDMDRKKWLAAIKKHSINWINVSDLKYWDGPTSKLYEVRLIPQYFLIDPQGKIVIGDEKIEAIGSTLEKIL